MSEQRRIEINWVQALAGSLAAMSSAVLLSTVGVAGTIIGAAAGSVIATVGSAVYSHYIAASKDRVAAAHAAALERAGHARARMRAAAAGEDEAPGQAVRELVDAEAELREARAEEAKAVAEPVGWKDVMRGLPWRRILLAAAGIFVVAMIVIVAFELVTGRAVSSYTGGSDNRPRTSIPGLVHPSKQPRRTPTPSTTPSTTPSGPASTASTPTPTTSEAPSPTPSAPTSEPTTGEPTPSETPSTEPAPSEPPSTAPAPSEPPPPAQ